LERIEIYDEHRLQDDHAGGGLDLRQIILPCIDKSDLFILLLTPNSDTSAWCQEEYERAKKNQARFGTPMVIVVYCSSVKDLQRYSERMLVPDPRRAMDEYEDSNEAWYRLDEVIGRCLVRLQRISWKGH